MKDYIFKDLGDKKIKDKINELLKLASENMEIFEKVLKGNLSIWSFTDDQEVICHTKMSNIFIDLKEYFKNIDFIRGFNVYVNEAEDLEEGTKTYTI